MRRGIIGREVEVRDDVQRSWDVVVLECRRWPWQIRLNFPVRVCVRIFGCVVT
jgi:hypothetical protein